MCSRSRAPRRHSRARSAAMEGDDLHEEISPADRAVILAHVAERAEQYDDMKKYMRERVETGKPLGTEERDLFSAAFKGALTSRRQAAGVCSNMEYQERKAGRSDTAQLAMSFRSRVQAELLEICIEALDLLRTALMPKVETGEAKIFYLKLQGDYNRYIAEVQAGEERDKAVEEARKAYMEAVAEADKHLLTTHPVRLGLALNYAVFQHEELRDTPAAINCAQMALTGAIQALEGMPEEAYQDAADNMQLLSENLKLWNS